jgi:nitrate reductase gamma subunit
MPVTFGAKLESDFTDPIGLLGDCHRRIERFLGVILAVAAEAGGALLGLAAAIIRRWTTLKIRTVSTVSDWVVYAMLFFQVASGVYIALAYPWGSSWFATSISPYLWSLVRLSPDISTIAPLPFGVKLHIVNAYLLIGFFPFTRLVHVLVIPNPYLWRKPQVVRWARRTS